MIHRLHRSWLPAASALLLLPACLEKPAAANPPTSAIAQVIAPIDRSGAVAPAAVEDEPISTYIRRIFQDRDGTYWFGTTSDGVARYDGRSLHYYTTAEGLSGNWVNAIAQDAVGDLWLATGGGVSRFDGSRFTRYTTANGLPSDQVWCLLVDRNGVVWVGTENGAARFTGDAFVPFVIPAADLSAFPYYKFPKQINAIAQDKAGALWFASNGGGAYRYDGQGLTALTEKEGLANNFVQSIMEDRSGKLWFGTRYGGISVLDPAIGPPGPGSFTTFTRKELHGDNVGLLFQDSGGTVWIGVSAIGLCSYDGRQFIRYTEKDGPGVRVVMSMLEDDKGQHWLGTGAGAYRFDGVHFTPFTKADALKAS